MYVTMPAPYEESYTDEQRDDDFTWYKDNIIPLCLRYGERYVAIKNKTILGVYDDKDDAFHRTCEYQTPGTFIVQKLGMDSRAYTVEMPIVWG